LPREEKKEAGQKKHFLLMANAAHDRSRGSRGSLGNKLDEEVAEVVDDLRVSPVGVWGSEREGPRDEGQEGQGQN